MGKNESKSNDPPLGLKNFAARFPIGLALHYDNTVDRRGKERIIDAMNTVIIRTPPPGNFEEISIEMPEWKEKFLNLVHQGKLIKYDAHNMPAIATDIRTELNKGNYCDFVLGRDSDRHFLVPRTS